MRRIGRDSSGLEVPPAAADCATGGLCVVSCLIRVMVETVDCHSTWNMNRIEMAVEEPTKLAGNADLDPFPVLRLITTSSCLCHINIKSSTK